MAAVEVAPVPIPLAVFLSFITQCPTTLIMIESVFSLTNSFTVRTLKGREVFKIGTGTFPLSSHKYIYDPENNHLFTLRKETFSIAKSFYAESPAGAKIFEVEGKLHFGTPRVVGHFINAMNGEQENLQMHGSFFNVKTEIINKKNGQVVAQINRQRWNARQVVGRRR